MTKELYEKINEKLTEYENFGFSNDEERRCNNFLEWAEEFYLLLVDATIEHKEGMSDKKCCKCR